jgi:hypothetical protein
MQIYLLCNTTHACEEVLSEDKPQTFPLHAQRPRRGGQHLSRRQRQSGPLRGFSRCGMGHHQPLLTGGVCVGFLSRSHSSTGSPHQEHGRVLPPAGHVNIGGAGTCRRGNSPSHEVGGRRALFHTSRGQAGVLHGDVRRGVCQVRGGHNAARRTSQTEESVIGCQLPSTVLPCRLRGGPWGEQMDYSTAKVGLPA